MKNLIIAEGDSGVARFFCAVCGVSFRAKMSMVTTANKQPVCLSCIEDANPKRVALGLPAIQYVKSAYLTETQEVA